MNYIKDSLLEHCRADLWTIIIRLEAECKFWLLFWDHEDNLTYDTTNKRHKIQITMYIIIMNTLVYVILNTSIISLTPISTMIQLYGMCQCIVFVVNIGLSGKKQLSCHKFPVGPTILWSNYILDFKDHWGPTIY